MTDDDVWIAIEAYRFSITKDLRPEKWNERADHYTAIRAAIAALEAAGWQKIGPDERVVSLSAECPVCGQRHVLGGTCYTDGASIAAKVHGRQHRDAVQFGKPSDYAPPKDTGRTFDQFEIWVSEKEG